MRELSYNSKEDTVQVSAHKVMNCYYIFPLLHIYDFQLVREHFNNEFL